MFSSFRSIFFPHELVPGPIQTAHSHHWPAVCIKFYAADEIEVAGSHWVHLPTFTERSTARDGRESQAGDRGEKTSTVDPRLSARCFHSSLAIHFSRMKRMMRV